MEPAEIDEVIVGNVLQAGQGHNPGRLAVHAAGLPDEVPAVTVNKLCGSSMKATHMATQAITCGDAEVMVAAGMENMSLAPYLLAKARTGYRMGDGLLEDHMLRDGLMCAVNDYHMGMTAENVAERYGVTPRRSGRLRAREPAPRRRRHRGRARSRTRSSPVPIPQKKGDPKLFDTDEHPRPETTLEDLARLKPAFKKDGTRDGRQLLRRQRRRGGPGRSPRGSSPTRAASSPSPASWATPPPRSTPPTWAWAPTTPRSRCSRRPA